MNADQARALLAEAGAALVAAVLIGGCGNNYRPVVTPVNTSGPPAQPTAYAVVVSSTGSNTPGVVTIVDYSGDSVMVEAPIGLGPLSFALDEAGGTGYTINSDATITNFPVSTQLQQKLEGVTTLSATAQPLNMLAPPNDLLVADLNGNFADLFSYSPKTFQLAVPVATTPVIAAGAPSFSTGREYFISDNFADSTGVACDISPTTAPAAGAATPIENSSRSADPAISLGKCPVYAVESPDQQRLFVMNRGDDTISVINTQANGLDACTPFVDQTGQTVYCHPTLPLSLNAVNAINAQCTINHSTLPPCGGPPNGTSGMKNAAGPIYAEYNQATNQLVVADFDGGAISVIDVSLDAYGNDSPTFGTTYTIPVGNNPASVTVLYDGSRAYSANQADETVTVVNLSSHTVEKTLGVVGHPRTVVSVQNSEYSKVYVASPDSPYLTIISSTPTQIDQVDTAVSVEGNVVDVRTTNQNGGTGNANFTSRLPGYGEPCNLPPGLMVSTYGPSYSLADCQAIP